jgi:DNA-binding GntR family transcriptional regulator
MLSTLRPYSPAPLELEPLSDSKNIARDVARTLRRAIVTLQIPPGTMLSEQDVGRKLGVSRQPVREAFIKLAEARLVVIRPQRGTEVVRISRAAVDDALFIRAAVECAVVCEAATRMDAECEALIADNLRRQNAVLGDHAFANLFILDEEFHQLIAQSAGRSAAWLVVENIKPHLDRVRWLGMDLLRPVTRLVRQHEGVFDALRRRDPDEAQQRMRVHVTEVAELLDPIAAHHPHLFDDAGPDPDEPGIPVLVTR